MQKEFKLLGCKAKDKVTGFSAACMEISGHHQPHQIPAILNTIPRARMSLIKVMAQAVVSIFSKGQDGT